jgi:hypothetical protein
MNEARTLCICPIHVAFLICGSKVINCDHCFRWNASCQNIAGLELRLIHNVENQAE